MFVPLQHSHDEAPGLARVARLAWPIVISMLSLTAMSVSDAILVGHHGTASLAAVGFASTVSGVFLQFGMGLLQGVRILGAQRVGARDASAVDRLSWQAVHLGGAVGLLVALIAPFSWPLVSLLGAGGEVARIAAPFLAIRLLGAPFLFIATGLAGTLSAREQSRTTMVGTLLGNLSTLAFDLIFIDGHGPAPALGVLGAAIGGVLGWALNLAFLVIVSARTLRATSARPDRALLSGVLSLGLPLGAQLLLDVSSFALFATLLVRVGEAQLAAHVIAVRIIGVSFLPGYAVGEASGVLVGQAVGARRPERADQAWFAGLRLAIALMAGWAFVFAGAGATLVHVFGAAPEVAAIARELLYIAAAFQLFDAVATVGSGALAGAGDTRFAMVMNATAAWLVKLPLAGLLAVTLGYGATGAWAALFVEVCVIAAVATWRIRSGRWLASIPPEPAAA